MKLKIPAGLYDAMFRLQKHCEKQDEGCHNCCFWSRDCEPGHNSCILGQLPEDWGDYNTERIENTIRPKNK